MKRGLYTGKEVCQGCGRTGSERSRWSKDSLCAECRDLLNKGKSVEHEEGIIYASVFQHRHAFLSESGLNEMVHNILQALHNPSAKTLGGIETIRHAFGSNGNYYKIPMSVYQPLKDMFTELYNKYDEHIRREKELDDMAKEAVSKEKDRIYNEGVERGKQALIMLNSGELSMSDFDKSLNYRK